MIDDDTLPILDTAKNLECPLLKVFTVNRVGLCRLSVIFLSSDLNSPKPIPSSDLECSLAMLQYHTWVVARKRCIYSSYIEHEPEPSAAIETYSWWIP
jgi:hypothetical protein